MTHGCAVSRFGSRRRVIFIHIYNLTVCHITNRHRCSARGFCVITNRNRRLTIRMRVITLRNRGFTGSYGVITQCLRSTTATCYSIGTDSSSPDFSGFGIHTNRNGILFLIRIIQRRTRTHTNTIRCACAVSTTIAHADDTGVHV